MKSPYHTSKKTAARGADKISGEFRKNQGLYHLDAVLDYFYSLDIFSVSEFLNSTSNTPAHIEKFLQIC